jgi:ribosome maturation factor RimP
MSTGSLKSRLLTVLAPLAESAGYDLEDVQVTPAGSRRLVRVLVDRDGGITLDDVAVLSRDLSTALDAPEAIAVMGNAPYVLEVSSPGVDHPLTLPRHWRRAIGRLVTVSVSGAGALTARVTATDGESVTFVREDGKAQHEVVHPLSALGKGAVQVEFSRPGAAADRDDIDEDDIDEDDEDDEPDGEPGLDLTDGDDEHDPSVEEARA